MTDDDVSQPLHAGPPTATTGAYGPARSAVELEDRYDLGGVLGRGGMGEVRVATDVRVDREVAVKLMRSDQTDEQVDRFLREGLIQARLDHPAIPPVFDVGVDPQGRPFIVMKRLSGTTLVQVLMRDPVPPAEDKYPRRLLLARLVEVCLAIELAHTRGIVHRDLKPSNIMLGDFGEVYVLDWGLARVLADARQSRPVVPASRDSGEGHTTVGSVLGTPGYMAPEQVKTSAVGPKADVYALGCILFEIVTGRTALPHGPLAIDATLESPCHRPSHRYRDLEIPPELDELCARATAADPAARPTARGLADAIQAYLDGDRDLESRRELAKRHASLAMDALVLNDEDGRARAMSEAGRAIVLDANNRLAQTVLARLLLEEPSRLPQQALADADTARGIARQVVLAQIWRGYAALSVAMCVLFAFPSRHPALVAAMIAMTSITGLIVWASARRPLPMRSPYFVAAVLANSLTLMAGCFVFGPFLIVPVFLVGSLAGALSQPTAHPAWQSIVPQLAAVAIPIALELAGITASTFHVDGGLVLTPYALELTPRLTVALLVVLTLSQSIVTVVLTLAYRRVQWQAQDRLHALTWHLRQLLPRGRAES